MQIVVTGATGFLAGHIITRLSKLDLNVTPVSRSKSEFSNAVQVKNYLDTPSGDVLIHLAENSNRAEVNRCDCTVENVASNLLEQLLKKNYKKVLYISSAAVYGDGKLEPYKPDAPVRSVDVYSSLKLACESLVLKNSGIVARLSNLYGPGMSNDNVLSTILRQIPCDDQLTIWSDKPVRDFLWVEDAAEVLIKMALSSKKGLYNVGSGLAVSIGDLVKIILELSGSQGCKIETTKNDVGNSYNVLDISKTRKDFHWSPKMPLHDGLKNLLSTQ